MEQPTAWLIVPLFLVAFTGLWLLVTTIVMSMADWPVLARRFPDREDSVLERFRMRSGVMGTAFPEFFGVNFGNCLVLDVTYTGLRVSTWKIFRPFSAPFLVPWSDITVQRKTLLLFPRVRLGFGLPEVGRLTIRPGLARQLAEASRGKLTLPPSP